MPALSFHSWMPMKERAARWLAFNSNRESLAARLLVLSLSSSLAASAADATSAATEEKAARAVTRALIGVQIMPTPRSFQVDAVPV